MLKYIHKSIMKISNKNEYKILLLKSLWVIRKV